MIIAKSGRTGSGDQVSLAYNNETKKYTVTVATDEGDIEGLYQPNGKKTDAKLKSTIVWKKEINSGEEDEIKDIADRLFRKLDTYDINHNIRRTGGMKKISDFIRKSPIGKSLDTKTLNAIDVVFEKAVSKAIEQNLAEKVAVENHKFKIKLMDTLDGYIQKEVETKFKGIAIDKSKVQIAEKIVASFKDVFGEMFVTEGSNKLAESLKAKIEEVRTLEENSKLNIENIKSIYEKKYEALKGEKALTERKYKLALKQMAITEAKKLVEGESKLTAVGKQHVMKLIEERSATMVVDSKVAKNMIENYLAKNGGAQDKPAKRVVSEKLRGERLGKGEDDGSGVSTYVDQMNKM